MPAQSTEPSATTGPVRPGAAGETLSFEAAMERLEAIVEQMENARLPLEELIRNYEEGTGLIRVCSERLSTAEQRIEMITRDAAGQTRVTEYPAAAVPAGSASPKPPPREPKTTADAPASAPSVSRSPKIPNEVSLF